MAITLSARNSKFMTALSSRLEDSVARKVEFSRAVIGEDASCWELYFFALEPLTQPEHALLEKAVRETVPAQARVTLHIDPSHEEEAAPDTEAAPMPEDSDAPPEAEPYSFEGTPVPEAEFAECHDSRQPSQDERMQRYMARVRRLQEEATKEMESHKKPPKEAPAVPENVICGREFPLDKVTAIRDLNEFSGRVVIVGDVIGLETKELRNGKVLVIVSVTDYSSSITVKNFFKADKAEALSEAAKGHVAVRGTCHVDSFSGELTVNLDDMMKVKEEKKTDTAKEKRIELHLHTKMSQMDGVTDAGELVKQMIQYGHDTVAITDHGVVQAYPDLEAAIKKNKADIKLIFGVEGYLLDDSQVVNGLEPDCRFRGLNCCTFAIRTSGSSPMTGHILCIAAARYDNGSLKETFQTLVNPGEAVDEEILQNCELSQLQLDSAPSLRQALDAFRSFAGDRVLVAHNAEAQMSFLRIACAGEELPLPAAYLDTARIAREMLEEIKTPKLNLVCDALNIRLEDDVKKRMKPLQEAECVAVVYGKLLQRMEEKKIFTVGELNGTLSEEFVGTYHIILYATNKKGLFNLYTLITESHLHHLHRKHPCIPRSLLIKHREGLLVASACEAGELFRAMVRGVSEQRLEQIASFYDYLEVQPLGNNMFMVRDGIVEDVEALKNLNRHILELGEKLHKPVIATGDVHFLRPRDAIFRSIIMTNEGFPDADQQAPLYYRTTQEMLDEFDYLPEEKRYEIVVRNPRALAERCEKMESFPRDHLYTPEMDHAEEDIRDMAEANARELYGDPLPDIVRKRLDKELNAIIKHGYAVLYLIAHKVVKKSLSDGYLVGSRGSVGSSFVATMTNITEVNPLPPHYVCPVCKYSDFDIDLDRYDCGVDMPLRDCPKCGTQMKRLGFNIPFEVFMGFNGDKVPDIDLNFSGVYQPVVHKYIEELFGHDYVFRAGTIGGVAEKTAIGYTLKYCEKHNLPRPNNAELHRLAGGCIEVKRTTGQHAGGVVILPKRYNINEFTPLQYPANDPTKGIITTHFTFESLHDTILKADILGHDDPTAIRMLEDLTGLDAKKDIPLDDPKVMDLFLSPASLGVTEEDIGTPVGTYGIPEFGTSFTMKMLVETKPRTFSDLIKISGLSHGTDVWTGNAQVLVASGRATLGQCICTREDIMNNLLQKGCDSLMSFKTMELVRKGKGLPPDYEEVIRNTPGIPDWFIDSCHKIKYMFPKAHAAAYVTMAIRIAWFKVYYPKEYYATYFSVRADDFDISVARQTPEKLKEMIRDYKNKPDLNPREKGILVMLEIALEMKMRHIDFADIDLYQSEALNFTITEDGRIRPPLNAVPGLGENAAQSIVEARKEAPFRSQEDLLARTRLSSTLVDALQEAGCLRDLPKSVQISLFDLV